MIMIYLIKFNIDDDFKMFQTSDEIINGKKGKCPRITQDNKLQRVAKGCQEERGA
jgi:hypothetical protein